MVRTEVKISMKKKYSACFYFKLLKSYPNKYLVLDRRHQRMQCRLIYIFYTIYTPVVIDQSVRQFSKKKKRKKKTVFNRVKGSQFESHPGILFFFLFSFFLNKYMIWKTISFPWVCEDDFIQNTEKITMFTICFCTIPVR